MWFTDENIGGGVFGVQLHDTTFVPFAVIYITLHLIALLLVETEYSCPVAFPAL